MLKNEDELPVFMCVGSDRVVGDSLAPIVSEYLIKKFKINAYVYGTLKNPITAKNINSAYSFIKMKHKNSKIIVVDATLANEDDVNFVKLERFGVVPAGFFNGGSSVMGDYSILGVVGSKTLTDKMFLSSVRINSVLAMAYFIALSIDFAVRFSKILKREKMA